jgi:hypothetical protein
MSIVKRIGVLFLFTLAGAIGTCLFAYASLGGAFIPWASEGTPPGQAVQVLAYGYVKTTSGEIYRHCGDSGLDCWIRSEAPQPEYEGIPLGRCAGLPSMDNIVDFKASCTTYGLGGQLAIFAVDKNGNAYSYHRADGGETGLVLILSPFLGALIGFVLGLAVLLYVLFVDFAGWLQKRTQAKNARDES